MSSAQTIARANAPVSFSATISSLPSGTTIHYRAVVQTDFATGDGGDRKFTTS
jgi:hypothetical protein